MALAYYNEIDPYAAQWLRNLVAAGHIAAGDVDERSIEDVKPSELVGYTQCHFFAGIGVWSHALRQAGWPDDKLVWTGSCPCQPFSAAGKGGGFDDERHLWPAFHHLIEQCKPATVIGEQVASKDANAWIDLVQVDLETLGYAFGAVPFPSASVGAPHIRDRLYWVADSMHGNWNQRSELESNGWSNNAKQNGLGGEFGGLADTAKPGHVGGDGSQSSGVRDATERHGAVGGLADTEHDGHFAAARPGDVRRVEQLSGWPDGEDKCFKSTTERSAELGRMERASAGPTNGFWRDADWLLCRDGKWRPVEPGTFPLAHGATSRVGRLRAYGNAINAKAAQVFIGAYLES
jgi:DNA (cytosine-5)-methyltransferase 1